MPNLKLVVPLAALVSLATPAAAQTWPTRPLTMVVPFAAGGATDVVGRICANISRTISASR